MSFPKATEQDRARFRSIVPDIAEVTIKPMFGNVAAFLGGHMFMGSFGSVIGVKLADADRARLTELPGTSAFGPEDRPMTGYVSLPPEWGPAEAEPWVALAVAHAAALPPKAPKPQARKAATAGKSLKTPPPRRTSEPTPGA
ncbi:MAG: TfoX/Sxy family protein [Acidimicrobiales bacterium]